MSSILSSQGVVLATAMAVSGTVIVLAFCRQKPDSTTQFAVDQNSVPKRRVLRSCINSDGKKRSEKKKKRVHFAADVIDPSGNSEEFRKQHSQSLRYNQACQSETHIVHERMPANRMALYNGILRDRVHRMACSY